MKLNLLWLLEIASQQYCRISGIQSRPVRMKARVDLDSSQVPPWGWSLVCNRRIYQRRQCVGSARSIIIINPPLLILKLILLQSGTASTRIRSNFLLVLQLARAVWISVSVCFDKIWRTNRIFCWSSRTFTAYLFPAKSEKNFLKHMAFQNLINQSRNQVQNHFRYRSWSA